MSLTNDVDIYNLHQLINSSTCIANTSSTLIDVVFTFCLNDIASAGVSNVGLSGHSLTYAFHKISSNSTMTYRKFGNFGSTRFCYDTSTKDWDRVNSYDDPNVIWNIWKNFFQCIDKHTHYVQNTFGHLNHPGSHLSWREECIVKMFSKWRPFALAHGIHWEQALLHQFYFVVIRFNK